MSQTASRAQDVAIILWELKRSQKLATLTAIASHAGFSAGPKQNTIGNCLKTVRRDWPHLEWWRAIADNGELQQDQALQLEHAGYSITAIDGTGWTIDSLGAHLQDWSQAEADAEQLGADRQITSG